MRAALVAALLLPALAPGSMGHADGGSGIVRSTVTVLGVAYSFQDGAPLALAPHGREASYAVVASQENHLTRRTGFGLGAAPLPAAAFAREDAVWVHQECAPLEAPVRLAWTLTLTEQPSPSVRRTVLTTASQVAERGWAGTFTDAWDVKDATGRVVLGSAAVTYRLALEHVPTAPGWPSPCP